MRGGYDFPVVVLLFLCLAHPLSCTFIMTGPKGFGFGFWGVMIRGCGSCWKGVYCCCKFGALLDGEAAIGCKFGALLDVEAAMWLYSPCKCGVKSRAMLLGVMLGELVVGLL